MASHDSREYIHADEIRDGVRFSWNNWPLRKPEATQLIVNLGCLFTPLKEKTESPIADSPILCTGNNCKAIINPFCSVDHSTKFWRCPFCLHSNLYPPGNLTANVSTPLWPHSTTIEYKIKSPTNSAPAFLLVVDSCMDSGELDSLKESLQLSLSLLPKNALIGLVTFGNTVKVHRLDSEGNASVFPGTKGLTADQIRVMLGPSSESGIVPDATGNIWSNYLQPVSKCRIEMADLLGDLERDAWPVPRGKRPLRSTGAALSVAVGLLECAFPDTGARIMLFAGGPCTQGPGMVVNEDEPIRSHADIEEGNAKYTTEATKHYESLASRACANGHAIDIFACSLDQTGLLEMKSGPSWTGGHMVMGDSFASRMFMESFCRVFAKDANNEYKMAFNGVMEVRTSKELKVLGAIGPCVSMNVKSPSVSETEIGLGGTCQWKFCTLGTNTTTAVYFEIVNPTGTVPYGGQGYIQFVTEYQHSSGEKRIRVTTIAQFFFDRSVINPNIMEGFDQEAAAVLDARLTVYKAEENPKERSNIMTKLDENVLRFCQKFGQLPGGDAKDLGLGETFAWYPDLIRQLLRSPFLNVVNSTPDETTFYRLILNREDVTQSLIMIHARVYSYGLRGLPEPFPLVTASIQRDHIILVDTFFNIFIFHGETLAQWRDELPEYIDFAQFIEDPENDELEILQNRFPLPRFIDTKRRGSNPLLSLQCEQTANSHQPVHRSADNGTPVLKEDVTLQMFVDRLKRLAVSSDQLARMQLLGY